LADRGAERGATRLKDKDALDVLRLLRAVPLEVLTRGLQDLPAQPIASEVTAEACQHLRVLFGTIAESCVALTDDLLGALQL
jgi:hypothetical protein